MISEKPREGYALWLFKMIAGCAILVVLAIHFVVNHLVAPGGLLSYADVINYYTIPIIPIMEVVFLLLVISHSLIGVRSIILDLNPPVSTLRYINWIMFLVGIGASIYGIWLVIVLVLRGQGMA